MTSENKSINDILALHFAGEILTDEQEQILVDWVCQHKGEYQRLSDLFQATGGSEQNTFKSDNAWVEVDKKLSTSKTFRLHKFRQVFSYAACIAFICATALYFLNAEENQSNQYFNTTASLLTVILPDSSAVTLYPQAKISYTADTKRNERKTELEGKAFFKVKSNTKQPFTVRSNQTAIRVLGTSFLVDGEKQSETEIFVREGVVQVSSDKSKVVLQADEQALSDENGIIKSKIENPEIIFNKHIKQMTYKSTPLSKIIKDIANEFKIEITYPSNLKDAKISTKLKFSTIEEVLSEISYICNCNYKKTTDKKFEFYIP